ncbi:hypothetical protein ACTXP6_15770, partial [Klebsiella pneumoniae]
QIGTLIKKALRQPSPAMGFSVLVASQLITLCAGGALLLRMRRAAAVNASIP